MISLNKRLVFKPGTLHLEKKDKKVHQNLTYFKICFSK